MAPTKAACEEACARNLPRDFNIKREQKEAVISLLQGKDVMAVLPTGFGKSFIYQLYVLARDSLTQSDSAILVVSPLRSIMEDQVLELEERDMPAVILSPSLIELDKIETGNYKIVFGAAEEFINPNFQKALKAGKLHNLTSLLVVDELSSHCSNMVR